MQITEFFQEVPIFHAATLGMGLFVASRFIARLPAGRILKLLLAVIVLVVSANLLLNQLIFGSMDAPERPRPLIILINWIFASVLLLAVLQIAGDLVAVLHWVLVRRRARPKAWVRLTMGVTALLLSALGVSQAVRVPSVRTVEIAIAELPSAFDGYRILQLSDLHISRLFPAPQVAELVASANKQNADLVVITGDLVDGTPEARAKDVAPLQKLQARDGVYMVPGNHEYYYDYLGWLESFGELGIRVLANEHVVIGHKGADLVLAGVTDKAATYSGLPGPDLQGALAGAPERAPIVLLDHQPRLASLAAEQGVDVQLSGHTHGGMIVGLDHIVARLNNGFVSGLYDVDGLSLYVSNGTASSPGFAVRLGAPSEMTTLVLRTR